MKKQARRFAAFAIAVMMAFAPMNITATQGDEPDEYEIYFAPTCTATPAALTISEEIAPLSVEVINVSTSTELRNALIQNVANRMIVIERDIDLRTWEPINISETSMGTFTIDGRGHVLSLSAERNGDFAGLFGDVSSMGHITIRNLGIFASGDGIRADLGGRGGNTMWAGGIAGRVSVGAMTIENSFVRGSTILAQSWVWSSDSNATIPNHAGGFIGEARDSVITIRNSYVNVTNIEAYAGIHMSGTGSLRGRATTRAGGFIGTELRSSVLLENSFTAGGVVARGSAQSHATHAGGFIGHGTATVTNSVHANTVNGTTVNTLGTEFTVADLRNPNRSPINAWNWNTTWTFVEGANANFPVLRVFHGPILDSILAIATHPSNQSVSIGQTATFTVSALANPAPAFQWQVSTNSGTTWQNLSGQTGATLMLANVTASMNNNRYRAIATNSVGSVASNVAILTVTGGTPIDPTAVPLTILTGFATPGEQVTVEFRLSTAGFAGMMFNISVPPELTLLSAEPGHPDLEYGFVGMDNSGESTGEYVIGWAGRSTNFNEIIDDNVILRLTFATSSGTALGFYPLSVTFANAQGAEEPTNIEGEILPIALTQGGVRTRQLVIGDLNADGRFTSLDATILARHLAGHGVSIDLAAAHITCDDEITTADLIRLARWLAGHFAMRCPHGGCTRCT